MHSSVLKSHHFLHNDRRGKKLDDPNWYLAAAFRTSTLFYQRFRAFWCCCIHLARCSITAVCLVCPQAVGLCTKHLKACLLWVYRLCPAVQEVYFLELLFFFLFFFKRHVSAGSFTHKRCFYLYSGRFSIQTREEIHDKTALRSAPEDVRNVDMRHAKRKVDINWALVFHFSFNFGAGCLPSTFYHDSIHT